MFIYKMLFIYLYIHILILLLLLIIFVKGSTIIYLLFAARKKVWYYGKNICRFLWYVKNILYFCSVRNEQTINKP